MLCPVCNGLEQLSALCKSCLSAADDCGRLTDYAGPYSPYQETWPAIEWVAAYSQSLERPEPESELYCVHIVYCTNCGSTQEVSVHEWL
jgi:hypothetical protein